MTKPLKQERGSHLLPPCYDEIAGRVDPCKPLKSCASQPALVLGFGVGRSAFGPDQHVDRKQGDPPRRSLVRCKDEIASVSVTTSGAQRRRNPAAFFRSIFLR